MILGSVQISGVAVARRPLNFLQLILRSALQARVASFKVAGCIVGGYSVCEVLF